MDRKTIRKILLYQEIFLIFLSFIWIYFKYGFIDFNNIPLVNIKITVNSFLLGLLFGVGLLTINMIIILTYEPLKKNLKTINNLLIDKLNYSDFVIISIFSGIAEELFFRGLLQDKIGIIYSNIFFALLHILNKEFLVYSLLVFVSGNILGNIYLYTNNLFIVIIAHIFNNFLAMLINKKYFKVKLENS